ncbi:MAG: hypothetical protein JNJ88_17955 [Planctomycetes bacterium]|nr:hypothetical protein [Planctomycetota bacterium]
MEPELEKEAGGSRPFAQGPSNAVLKPERTPSGPGLERVSADPMAPTDRYRLVNPCFADPRILGAGILGLPLDAPVER